MTAVYIICFLLMAAGTIILLGLNPEQVNRDVSEFFDKKQSLKDRSLKAQGRKRKNRLLSELEKTKRALEETGKGRQFSIACAAALLLIVAGCVLSLAIDNPFLIPVLSIAFAVIPFSYIKRTMSLYEARMKEELEIALSIITTSYV